LSERIDIEALRPTIIGVEEAFVWLAGDSDIFDAGGPPKPLVSQIVEILTADEEEAAAVEMRAAQKRGHGL
jgi:hypothetical protein